MSKRADDVILQDIITVDIPEIRERITKKS